MKALWNALDRWRARREEKRAAAHADSFWRWFASVAADGQKLLRREPSSGEEVSPDLAAWIHELNWRTTAYHPLVRAVVGTSDADLELVLTSDGHPEGAAGVRALAQSAPVLPGWTMRAFKPRMEMSGCVCRVGEVALTPDDVDYAIIDLQSPEIGTFTLFVLFIPGFEGARKEEVGIAADQLLQAVLGEERVIRWSPFTMEVDSHEVPEKLEGIPRTPLSRIDEELESIDHLLGPSELGGGEKT